MSDKLIDYRASHASEGYGDVYNKVYKTGYYATQWTDIEEPLLRTIFSDLYNKGGRVLLDFACGTGRILKLGEEIFDETVGVDVSLEMTKHARKLCRRSKIYCPFDITKEMLDLKPDIVTAFRFFLNAQPDLRRDVLSAIARMQNEGGVLVCNTHVTKSSPLGWAYRLRNLVLRRHSAATLCVTSLTRLVEQAGYNIVSIYPYSYWPRIGNVMPRFQEKMLSWIEKMQSSSQYLPPYMAQCCIVVACRYGAKPLSRNFQ